MFNDLVLREARLGAFMGMWLDSLLTIPPIRYFLVAIRGAGPCEGDVHTLHVRVM